MKKNTTKNNSNKDIISQINVEFKRHTTVLMEHMTSQVKVIAEGHSGLVAKINNIESDLGIVKSELGIVKSELGIVKSELGIVKSDLGSVKSELGTVKMAVVDNSRQIKELKTGQEEIKQKLNTAITNHEERITKIEEKIHQ